VFFSEIIEHITFNPVEFWRAVYRVLRPGGRIVVTTPNYYSPYSRVWDPGRFWSGFGGGISVHEILTQNTYSHHWKEFTVRELIIYFDRLSPDFNIVKARHFPSFDDRPPEINRWARWAYRWKRRNPLDHANIYMEVELRAKESGIVVSPSW
jgi:2-polyprenyl-6-hydroxyphenyl methylase/3-demethylubiquinone-9 3-methyltransferase